MGDRIVHVIADVPESCPSPWEREAVQREQALPALADAAPDDVVLVADTDEILTAPVYEALAGLPGAVTMVWMTGCYLLRICCCRCRMRGRWRFRSGGCGA